jgi:hypothetical protein
MDSLNHLGSDDPRERGDSESEAQAHATVHADRACHGRHDHAGLIRTTGTSQVIQIQLDPDGPPPGTIEHDGSLALDAQGGEVDAVDRLVDLAAEAGGEGSRLSQTPIAAIGAAPPVRSASSLSSAV